MSGHTGFTDNNAASCRTENHQPTVLSNARLAAWQLEKLRHITLEKPILVTDDNTLTRNLYRSLFQLANLNHLDTPDSLEALDICRTQPISLIISDIMKPQINGLQLLEHLQADPATRHIPLLFISATAHVEIALRSGAAGFLKKPCHPNEILQEIWRLLSK